MKNTILLQLAVLITLFACSKDDGGPIEHSDDTYRQEMRDFVIGISQYSKAIKPDFAIIPQNGIELVTNNGEEDGDPNTAYLQAIDGNGQEDLFYGYDEDDQPTPTTENIYLRGLLDVSLRAGNRILVTDYCSTPEYMDDSYQQNTDNGYVSFAADERDLNQIPSHPAIVHQENNANVTSLSQVKNFLYLINPEKYATKASFINEITNTNYDLLIMDLFFTDGSEFTPAEIEQLRTKANGGKRMVVAYMSIGEAESYRYYWQTAWDTNKPAWMDEENPDWEGNYKVKYWDEDWQNIIYRNDTSYLKKILNANFDGVYLDIIDAFEYYE